MAVLPVTLFGDKILRKKTVKIQRIDDSVLKLAHDMFETMKVADGIGIAANQVGSDRSIFIIDLSDLEGYENEKPIFFLNAKITEYGEARVKRDEGCLSLPYIREVVERPNKIKITFKDLEFNDHELEAEGFLARVIQHEYDHTRGVLFSDRVDDEAKKKIKDDLLKIKHRKISVDYPVTQLAAAG